MLLVLTEIGISAQLGLWVMSCLYELLGSKDANGRKPLIGQPKALEACVL
jgi:hypothetical protein